MGTLGPKRERDYCLLEADPSLAAPAVRMVVVSAASHGRATRPTHAIYPVLAIRACNRHQFSRPADGRIVIEPPSVAACGDYGWDWDWSEIAYESIILAGDHGLAPATEALDRDDTEWREFVADWPAGEDEGRLAGAIARLEQRAARKVAAAKVAAGVGVVARPVAGRINMRTS